jgi:hypothetical protein
MGFNPARKRRMKKGLTQISQMTQIKNENRYGMNRMMEIIRIFIF